MSDTTLSRGEQGSWERELANFGRAAAGAFLFGTPLLYTMEMWWIGEFADLWKLVAFMAIAFVSTFGLNYFAGFKQQKSFMALVDQSVEAMAVAVVGSVLILVALNRIGWGEPLDAALGKVVVQSVPLSIGAAIANAVFGGSQNRQGEGGQGSGNRGGQQGEQQHRQQQAAQKHSSSRSGSRGDQHSHQQEHHDHILTKDVLNDAGATAIGAVFIGLAIAPTAEIPKLAAEITFYHELALIGLSLAVGYIIVFVSGFDPSTKQGQRSAFQHPITETVLSYIIALLVSFMLLFLFDRIELSSPLYMILAQVVVLGFVATVGGAAGRLAV